jgi:hypothetical protein
MVRTINLFQPTENLLMIQITIGKATQKLMIRGMNWSSHDNEVVPIKLAGRVKPSDGHVIIVRRTPKSGHAVAKLSYGGGVREIDRRSWMSDQG